MDAKLIKRLMYLKAYGLLKDTEADRAWGVVLHREEEDITRPLELEMLMTKYTTSSIKSVFGISFDKVMALPEIEFDLLREHSERAAKTANNVVDELLGDK